MRGNFANSLVNVAKIGVAIAAPHRRSDREKDDVGFRHSF